MTAKFSIAMTVYNHAELTGDRLLELDRLFRIRGDFELIITNNASKDRTYPLLKWWKDNQTWRMLIKNCRENIGFGPGVNHSAKSARGDILVVISNDVVINGDFLGPILDAFGEAEDELLCAARVVDWQAGWNEFPPEPPIPYAEGWFFAIRTKLWRKLKGFDPIFAPHDYEDIDLSYRATKAGAQIRLLDLPIEHIGAGTIGFNPSRRRITEVNRKKFAKKWKLKWTPVR